MNRGCLQEWALLGLPVPQTLSSFLAKERFFFLYHESKTIKVMIVQDDPTRIKNLYDIKETLKSERTSQNKENIFLKNQISLEEKWAIE